MNCKVCNKEFIAKRNTAIYCSAKCRKLAFKGTVTLTVPVSVPHIAGNPDNPIILKEIKVKLNDVCTPEELNLFPAMCETKRASKEAVYRLENNELKDLKENGVFIPAWRYHSSKYPLNAKV